MIIHKLTPVANETALLLNKDPSLVADVIQHVFASIKSYIENPTKAGIRVENFGVIRPYSASLTKYLKRLILKLRDPLLPLEYKEELKKTFRIF